MMKDVDFELLRGFASRLTDERTDICECRVAFATEKDSCVTHKSSKYHVAIIVTYSTMCAP